MAEEAKKIGCTPEHSLRTRIGLTIGRGVWLAGYKIEHRRDRRRT